MKTGITKNIRAVSFGIVAAMVLSLGLSALGAALFSHGMLPIASIHMVAWFITALASGGGAMVCAGMSGEKRLPLSLAAGLIYLLVIFVFRGLLFGEVAAHPWPIPLCVLLGCTCGALASSKKKRRKY